MHTENTDNRKKKAFFFYRVKKHVITGHTCICHRKTRMNDKSQQTILIFSFLETDSLELVMVRFLHHGHHAYWTTNANATFFFVSFGFLSLIHRRFVARTFFYVTRCIFIWPAEPLQHSLNYVRTKWKQDDWVKKGFQCICGETDSQLTKRNN